MFVWQLQKRAVLCSMTVQIISYKATVVTGQAGAKHTISKTNKKSTVKIEKRFILDSKIYSGYKETKEGCHKSFYLRYIMKRALATVKSKPENNSIFLAAGWDGSRWRK